TPLCSPVNRSLKYIAASGTMQARRFSSNWAPANRARAPMGVKLDGCGTSRNAAAPRIIAINNIARGFIFQPPLIAILNTSFGFSLQLDLRFSTITRQFQTVEDLGEIQMPLQVVGPSVHGGREPLVDGFRNCHWQR